MNSIVKTVFGLSIIIGIMVLIGWVMLKSPVPVESAYVKIIDVDDSEKIEQALSNAVNDVESRNFIVTEILLKKCPLGDVFSIKVGGQDRGRLLSLRP